MECILQCKYLLQRTPFAEKIDSLTDVEAKKLFNLIMSDTKERVWDVKAEGRRLFNLWENLRHDSKYSNSTFFIQLTFLEISLEKWKMLDSRKLNRQN